MPAITLSATQRAALRAQAHVLKPVVLIGAEGLTEPVFAETERALVSHQLIKIRVAGDDRPARLEIGTSICERLGAAQVQHIGKLLVIWRPEITPRSPGRSPGHSPGHASAETRRSGTRAASNGAPRKSALPLPRATGPGRSDPRASTRSKTASSSASTATARPRATDDDNTARKKRGAPLQRVTIVKPTGNPLRRPKPQHLVIRGNERVTAGGTIKKAKKRQTSSKRTHQLVK